MVEFEAFVLTGGTSARMGRDKSLIEIDGTPMAKRVVDRLESAGATRVRCIGGDRGALAALGMDVLGDDHPGAGPLAGVLVALQASETSMTVVAPCDLIEPPVEGFVALVTALASTPHAQVSVPSSDGTWRPLPCVLRTSTRPAIDAAFAAGERAVHRVLAQPARVEVSAVAFADADSPGDLPGRR